MTGSVLETTKRLSSARKHRRTYVRIDRLTMIYDADKGLRGHVSYAFGMLRGEHCALCDITHGRIRRRTAFEDLTCSLSMPVEVIYRNQQDPELADLTAGAGGGAAVVAHTEAGLRMIMDDGALEACGGDVDAFAAELAARIEEVQTAAVAD